VRRALLNKCTLIRVTERTGWNVAYELYDFYYYNKKVASVHLREDTFKVVITDVFSPWSKVINHDETQTLCRFHRVEDEFHGVDLIDDQVIMALYLEMTVNDRLKQPQMPENSLDSISFAKLLQKEMKTLNWSNVANPAPIQPMPFKKSDKHDAHVIGSGIHWNHYKNVVKITSITPDGAKSEKKRRKGH
jgi:hypothetical protein